MQKSKRSARSTAEEVLGIQKKKIQSWVTNKVLDLCDKGQQLKQQKYTSTKAGPEYRKVKREVKKKVQAAKKEWTDEQHKNTEKGVMTGNREGA